MIEINNTTKFKINNRLIKKVAEKFLKNRHLSEQDVSIAFVGDNKMRELNRHYRKIDKITDVLSFSNSPLERGGRFLSGEGCRARRGGVGSRMARPERSRRGCVKSCLSESDESRDLGEIIINPVQIKRQAKENNNSFQAELLFILVHGLLHLVGYDDKTEKGRSRMIKLGERFIRKLEVRSKK